MQLQRNTAPDEMQYMSIVRLASAKFQHYKAAICHCGAMTLCDPEMASCKTTATQAALKQAFQAHSQMLCARAVQQLECILKPQVTSREMMSCRLTATLVEQDAIWQSLGVSTPLCILAADPRFLVANWAVCRSVCCIFPGYYCALASVHACRLDQEGAHAHEQMS